MISIDPYLTRTYNRKTYNCLHFTRDVWLELTGEDITSKLFRALSGRVHKSEVVVFKELREPTDPCIVVMQRPHSIPHVGVYMRSRVLHLRETGAEFQPVDRAAREFKTVRYFL